MKKYKHNKNFNSFFDGINLNDIPKSREIKKMTTLEFITKAKNIHGDRFDYSKTIYNGMPNKIIVICKAHNVEIAQTPINHLHGPISCPMCNKNINLKITRELFVKRAVKKHSNKFDYSLVNFKDENDIIQIICPKHGVFKQNLRKHLRGGDCPDCIAEIVKTKAISVGETQIEIWLKRHSINFNKQKTFNNCKNKIPLRFDFYLPEYNMLIEYDGKQHYEPIEYMGGKFGFEYRKQNDKIKSEFAEKNNIDLLRISYKEVNDISMLLKNKLINI